MVSIVMPAYNSAAYLRKAIDSILSQTLTDFELLVVNDGSSDDTEKIILSYSDNRIRYLKNDVNAGLVFTLNKGLEHAQGEYIARMDGDDIALPHRLNLQVTYLKSNPGVSIVASVVRLIDEQDHEIGYWEDDQKNISAEDIYRFLPHNNCIAHPSVLARTEVLKRYKYLQNQSQAEDYDLWLRIAADGNQIHKIAEPLLLHRILSKSYTRQRQKNIFYKLSRTKRSFFANSFRHGKINSFVFKTGFYGIVDLFKGLIKNTRSSIKA